MPLKLFGPIQLASAQVGCWKCKARTPVHAVVPSDLEEMEDGGIGRVGEAVFVYEIEEDDMPGPLAAALRLAAPTYQPLHSRSTDLTAWANGCAHCGALQGAFFLHAEPDGPFFGMPRDFEGELTVLVNQDLQVDEASFGLG